MQGVPEQLSELPSYLIYILLNPTFNLKAALLLYGILGVLLLIILVVGVIIFMRSPEEDRVSESAAGHPQPPARRVEVRRQPMGTPGRLAIAAAVVVLIGAAWAITGYTTSNPAVCKGCHGAGSEHAKAPEGSDPHGSTSCVSCHEPGGTVGRYLTGVPARLLHFADSQSAAPQPGEYGRVTVVACSSCHEAALVGVATNETRGLKVSHSEPLAASATCVDCHKLSAGVVGAHNAGMAPCLRCHDEKQASAECVTCHEEKAASAARARTTSFADVQIPEVSCGGCHDEKQECDWCHGGVRLPHSLEFQMYAHARAGAVDFWYNGGNTCAPCHNASKRPCQKCHGALLGNAHGTEPWLAGGHKTAPAEACDTCHKTYAYAATRDFCKDLCHTPAAVAASPR